MTQEPHAHSLAKTKVGVGFFVLSLGLLAVGCSGKGTISGKVLYQGKPLRGGAVTFFPSAGGGAFTTHILADGSYSVEKVPPGQAKIAIAPPVQPRSARMQAMAKALKSDQVKPSDEMDAKMPTGMKKVLENTAAPTETVSIPEQYRDPDKSGLECTVIAGSQTHDIELK